MTKKQLLRLFYSTYYSFIRNITGSYGRLIIKTVILIISIIFLYDIFNPWFYSHHKIKNSVLNATLFLSSAILAFLSLIDELGTWANKKFFKALTFKFCLILFACDLAFIATDKKDDQNDADKFSKEKTDSVAKVKVILDEGRKNDNRNKLYQDSLNSGLSKMARIFNTALGADQNKYKEARDQIAELVKNDSAKENKYYSLGRPVLDINRVLLIKRTPDSLYFELKLDCRQATSYDIHLITKIAIIKNSKFFRTAFDNDEYNTGEQLEAEKYRTAAINLRISETPDVIAFNVIGYFTDFINRSQHIPFDKLIFYDLHKKQLVSYDSQILNLIKTDFNKY